MKDFLCANSATAASEIQKLLNELTTIAKTIGELNSYELSIAILLLIESANFINLIFFF